MYIALGSTSKLKTDAVREAFFRNVMGAHVVPYDVESGVNAQPVGYAEIVDGAHNRAERAFEAYARDFGRKDCWSVGIENGIVEKADDWHDVGLVLLRAPNGERTYHYTTSIKFPETFVNEAKRAGFDTTTVGSIIAEHLGGEADDPMSTLTNGAVTRKQQIIDALNVLLVDFEVDHPVHKVAVDGHTLWLPVVEIKPGLRLAVFNPLGNWQVNEFLGKRLARLVPPGTDAFLMADGKAQALLHVVARECDRLSVVARKEIKPYMVGAISADAVTITTQKRQTLYLDEPSRLALEGRRVVIVDDVVSSGATVIALKELIEAAGGTHHGTLAAFTEGDRRDDVISLGHLPLL